ncbi:MAG: signal peptidase II [Armatimonadota bacterium]
MILAMHGKRRLPPLAFYVSALLVATLDQLSKAIVLAKMPLGEPGTIPLIPGIFHFTHVRNTGIAFSMLEGKIPVILIASAVVMLGIILTERKAAGQLGLAYGIALSMPLGGALGNMIDRIRFGNVVDFIDVRGIKFAIFNVADSAITVGIVWLLLLSFMQPTPLEREAAQDAHGNDSPSGTV